MPSRCPNPPTPRLLLLHRMQPPLSIHLFRACEVFVYCHSARINASGVLSLSLQNPFAAQNLIRLRGRRQSPLTTTSRTGWWRRHLQLCVLCHHPLESDSYSLNDCQQDRAADGAVSYRLGSTTYCQRSTSEEASDDSVPRVLLLPHALDGAVKCTEHASPYSKVAAEHGCAGLDCCDGWTWVLVSPCHRDELLCAMPRTSYSSLTVRAVPVSFYAVPYCSSYRLSQRLDFRHPGSH